MGEYQHRPRKFRKETRRDAPRRHRVTELRPSPIRRSYGAMEGKRRFTNRSGPGKALTCSLTLVFGEGEEIDLNPLITPFPLQQYHGGNLRVIPSQAQPGRQLANVPVGSEAAISSNSRHLSLGRHSLGEGCSESPCLLRGESPSPYGTLVIQALGSVRDVHLRDRRKPSKRSCRRQTVDEEDWRMSGPRQG